MNTKAPNRWESIQTRISKLEKIQGEQGLELSHIRSEVDSVSIKLDRIAEAMSRSGKPNYGVWASWITIIITVVGILMLTQSRETDLKFVSEQRGADEMRSDIKDLEAWKDKRTENQFTSADGEKLEERLTERIKNNEDLIHEHQRDGHPRSVLDQLSWLEKSLAGNCK